MTVTTKRSIIALLLSLVLVVSIFTVCASATDATSAQISETVTETEAETEKSTTAETETEKTTSTETESSTNAETTSTKKEEVTTEAAIVGETRTSLIINGVIIAVIILILVLVAVKFRKKLAGFLRSVKSELKKIVWSSKENTRKSFLVVAVVAVAVAALIFVIDYAFTQGIEMLGSLFK